MKIYFQINRNSHSIQKWRITGNGLTQPKIYLPGNGSDPNNIIEISRARMRAVYAVASVVFEKSIKNQKSSECMKTAQFDELYNISWKNPTLAHITHANTIRVYRVTSSSFFPPKIIFQNCNFMIIFTLFHYSGSTK